MVGPFKRSKDKKIHLLVAVDKFTKWVEAEPVSKCDAATAVQFIKKVIFRFGFPHSIITNNGTNLSKGISGISGSPPIQGYQWHQWLTPNLRTS